MGAINWRVVGPVVAVGVAVLAVFFAILTALGNDEPNVPRVIATTSPAAPSETPEVTPTRHPGMATAIPTTPTEEPTRTPTASPTPEGTVTATPTPRSGTGVTAVAKQPSHVRAQPEIPPGAPKSNIISDVYEGETVEVTGRDHEETYWLRVIPPDGRPEGWVSADRFEVKGDLSKVPIIEHEHSEE